MKIINTQTIGIFALVVLVSACTTQRFRFQEGELGQPVATERTVMVTHSHLGDDRDIARHAAGHLIAAIYAQQEKKPAAKHCRGLDKVLAVEYSRGLADMIIGFFTEAYTTKVDFYCKKGKRSSKK